MRINIARIFTAAPKKPNWDLRRGIEHKMEILEKRTQKAMIQLLSKFNSCV